MQFDNGNPSGKNVVAINYDCFLFLVSKIIKIEFKMKLQSFFWNFPKCLQNYDSSYLSHHLLEWNESKLPMFRKIYTKRIYFLIF